MAKILIPSTSSDETKRIDLLKRMGAASFSNKNTSANKEGNEDYKVLGRYINGRWVIPN